MEWSSIQIIEGIKEEYNHAIELIGDAPITPTTFHAIGHAQCASILLDKFDRPNEDRNHKMDSIFQKVIK